MLICLDVETTGLEEQDRICSIGMIIDHDGTLETIAQYVKPPRKIRPEAMAVHHITNEMVASAPLFTASDPFKWLEAHNSVENILVGHNILFDLEMLQKEGFVWRGGMIDTLKCTRHLIEEIEQYGLQFLRYELGLYREEDKLARQLGIDLVAHTVLSDALHVLLLHRYLESMADRDRLLQLSVERVLLKKLTFGKYAGRYIEEIAMIDRGYLHWLLENIQEMDGDLDFTIRHYLES